VGRLELAVVDHGPTPSDLRDERRAVAVARSGHGHPLIVALGCPAATSTACSRDRRARPGLAGDRTYRLWRSIWSLERRVSEKERERVVAQGSPPEDCSARRWSMVGRLPGLRAGSRFHAGWHKHPRRVTGDGSAALGEPHVGSWGDTQSSPLRRKEVAMNEEGWFNLDLRVVIA
jgi:hypothetical protein